jgi:hypothetical protein
VNSRELIAIDTHTAVARRPLHAAVWQPDDAGGGARGLGACVALRAAGTRAPARVPA